MAERVELNEADMMQVNGGAFRYKEDDNGDYLCKVDGIGIFYASENAKRKINNHWIETGCVMSDQELVDWALDEGYLWN